MIRKKRIWISIKYFLYLLILIVLYAMQPLRAFFPFSAFVPSGFSHLPWQFPCAKMLCPPPFSVLSAVCFAIWAVRPYLVLIGLLVLCGCVAISLLSFFLIKVNWKSALLLGGALAAIRALLEFFFFYLIWGYENIQLIFIHSVLPIFIYTTVLTPLFLLLIRKIKEKCDGQWKE